ncbi:jg26166, partial [Pararge aegeria aegeria]
GALGWLNYATRDFDFQCGASLISEKFMLTAAHCTIQSSKRGFSKRPTIARLGTRYLEGSPMETAENIGIWNLIAHPDFNPEHHYYDIALVELEREVIFSKYIQPACLSTREYDISSNKRLTVTGWGQNGKHIFKSPIIVLRTTSTIKMLGCEILL